MMFIKDAVFYKISVFSLKFIAIFIFPNYLLLRIFKSKIMKKIIAFILLLMLSISVVSAQSTAQKKDPVGKWKFEAPYAPEEYSTGAIDVGLTDGKYSTTIIFTGSDSKVTGEKVKFENDTVSFAVYIEGNEVSISLKMENDTKMAGKAISSEGEIPLTLTKEPQNK